MLLAKGKEEKARFGKWACFPGWGTTNVAAANRKSRLPGYTWFVANARRTKRFSGRRGYSRVNISRGERLLFANELIKRTSNKCACVYVRDCVCGARARVYACV